MKIKITSKRIALLLVGTLFVVKSFSQTCTGTLAEMTIKNITATSTTIEYDIYIKNIGTTTEVKLGGINGNVVYTPGLLSATTTSALTIIEQPNSVNCAFPTLATITNIVHTAASQQMRYTQTIQNAASGNTVIMPIGIDMKFARFRLTSSEPFALTSVTLRLPNGEDGPSITRNIGTLYCNGNTNSTNFAGTLSTMQVGGPYIVDLTTLGSNEFDIKNAVQIFPNPSKGIFNIEINSDANIDVYDFVGKNILSNKVNIGSNYMDLSNFSAGTYFVKIADKNNQTKTIRIIKE